MKTYKGFDKDLKCRGFQYEVGKTYTHDGDVEACSSGFHACEHPLDVFSYYPPAGSRFAVVEQAGELCRHEADSKAASAVITIVAEIGISDLVEAAVSYIVSRCTPSGAASATGDYGAASATGDYGAASATGGYGAASATGDYGAASATGDYGAASATGWRGAASATGLRGRAMGTVGNALFLVHRNSDGVITHVGAAIVGENGIKPNVWYELDEKGAFCEID